MNDIVTVTRDNEIAVVIIDNPPVNALSHAMRAPLNEALIALRDDDSVKGVVVTCAGRTFVAGADISEFGGPRLEPSLLTLIATLESFSTKPTVAAIHGTALGGGLELALGCRYRVAVPSAMCGLPEVKLGLIPGAGGTQRLPRVIGPEKALQAIVAGRFMPAKECLADGLVDAIVEGEDLVAGAVDFLRKAIADGKHTPLPRDREDRITTARADISAFDALVKDMTKKARGLEAPHACAQSVRNAITMPFEEGYAEELRIFLKLLNSDQSRAQRHLFFAEREAGKVAGVTKDVKPREVKKAGVIGAGTMGGGIAMSLVNGGIPVTILEMAQEPLDKGLERIRNNYEISAKRGSMKAEDVDKRMALFTPTTSYDDLADCDIIIEAVFEEMGVKEQVFKTLDRIAKPGAILASNTSYLDVNAIAAFTNRPQDVIGMHFFSPANVMKLLEIVRGDKTAPDVLATAMAVGKKAKKVPVVVGVCHGFVGNRMLAARSAQSEALLLEGALPETVDKAFRDFGWPMGPFQMGDLAGNDIGWRTRKSLGKTAALADPLCEAGRYGQKTGAGWYRYEDGRTPIPDAWVEKLILDTAASKGINRRDISDEEIIERTIYPMINEGAKILDEGIAQRASDIDVVWIYGYGFPIGKGGPMHWAETLGLATIVERLDHWHGRTGAAVFEVSPLLRRLASEGKRFKDAS
ncbi:3-hydroxyacyl-CoA dehydrogenase [Zhengella mangrovi]|uniref:3-hydroxyacyl-CoA dehydrogenase n=1 Tax=Zhengella mangrovi TaxID=1982044 RepID=A0A2G1QKX7_9HYPH|nr:3-hydroxyacyl-CoA dehydrogenase NAD-binding domain-containing protein [Zhengella mangrovi]PHP66187.1 3-hydroxyacyl-CoA dehydrogenase [Zhengella mangrovi]